MAKSWQYFLLLLVVALMIQGFYSMLEMACVSFNRVRLQYYVSKNNRRAKWLNKLLSNPAHLFGATLIGVNGALQFGSECARRLYSSLGLNPDWSALSQVFVVLIFAELAPMFAARRYAENVTMLGVPIIYFTSIILRPITMILEGICRVVNWFFGVKTDSAYLSREELQRAIEERDDTPSLEEKAEFDPVLSNIFSLKTKTAKDLMDPINKGKLISSEATIGDLRHILGLEAAPFVPVFHKTKNNIVAIAFPRDLLRHPDETRLRAYSRSPWFVMEKNSILEIIKEFRRNNQSLAIVLNQAGLAVGILTLDAVVDEIFGQRDDWVSFGEFTPEKHRVVVDRSLPGETKVADINLWFKLSLPGEEDETLDELMTRLLGHRPEKGEPLRVGEIELMVEETSLIAGRTISIRSI